MENIWINITKGQHIMTPKKQQLCTINGIRVWRPLYSLKRDVVKCWAHSYGTRWVRDDIVKSENAYNMSELFMNDMYAQFNGGYADTTNNNIDYVAETLKEYGSVVDQYVINPIVTNWTVKTDYGYSITLLPRFKNISVHTWQTIIRRLFQNHTESIPSLAGTRLPSRKAIHYLTVAVNGSDSRSVELNGSLYCYVKHNPEVDSYCTVYLLDKQKISNTLGIALNKLGNREFRQIKLLL
jgi:hypothetical protein